ncbi:MAG: DUF4221 domain-containing protein [Tannerellaceae bacterium]|jgi:hypothetical protein|nr:DUF4221 domain-containing protein [Tannerellaceae bacterium]
MKTFIYQFLLLLFLFSCDDSDGDKYYLNRTSECVSFDLDASTNPFIPTLSLFHDENNEYLTIENRGNNQILFYDFNAKKLSFKINVKIEGDNGVGQFLGYYIHNMDSIFLTVSTPEFPVINKNAKEITKLQYNQSSLGLKLYQNYSITSIVYHPLEIIDNRLYAVVGANRHAEREPVSITVDLLTGAVDELDFHYPSFPNMDNAQKRSSSEEGFSRCFDGEQFIYSFHYDEYIYVASIDHKNVKKVRIKSKYIDRVVIPDDYNYSMDLRQSLRMQCESPNYGNLIYDKYRNVYYRIAYLATTIEKDVDAIPLFQFGRKNFSIIILDHDFNIIGETMFPDYTYNSYLMFVHEDGLYMSNSHCMNPSYSDDILSFERFDLVKK